MVKACSLGNPRQEGCKFKATMNYIMSSRPAWFYSETLKEKIQNKQKTRKWGLTNNFLCVHVCTCAYKHIEARGQPCVSFSGSAYTVVITVAVIVRQGLL